MCFFLHCGEEVPSAKYEFETGTFDKRAKISVPRDQRNAAVDAALSDQSITEPCLPMLRQNPSPQLARPLPIPGADVDHRQIRKGASDRGGKRRIAQQFGKHWRHHHDLSVPKRLGKHLHIISALSLKERDPRAGVATRRIRGLS